jgi:hypothetical protein
MPSPPASSVIIGMMGMFGGIAHVSRAVMLMVASIRGWRQPITKTFR